jgi:uncharacterized damage-inducible protein DinB
MSSPINNRVFLAYNCAILDKIRAGAGFNFFSGLWNTADILLSLTGLFFVSIKQITMIQEITTLRTKEATIVSLMKNYADYNCWANTELVNWLRTKDESLLEKHVLSSFPSIKLTLVHIWQTERYWLSILQRKAPENYSEFTGTTEEALDLLLEKSAELAEYVQRLSEEEIEETTLIVNPWFQSDFQNLEYIMHACNHSTYHRGQVITIGRNLGFTDAVMTDYNFYNVRVRG